MLTGVLLAAGRGQRMAAAGEGTPKLLLPLQGRPLVRWAAEALASAGDPLRVAVLPPGETGKALEKALAGLGFSTVIQPQPERGLRASFGAAAQTFPPEITGAVFALGDMPLVRPETHRQLRQAAFGGRRPAVCRYGAVTAPPLFLPSSLFPALLALPDADTGPRELLRGAASVTCPAAELLDIDTPQALAAAARAMTP